MNLKQFESVLSDLDSRVRHLESLADHFQSNHRAADKAFEGLKDECKELRQAFRSCCIQHVDMGNEQ